MIQEVQHALVESLGGEDACSISVKTGAQCAGKSHITRSKGEGGRDLILVKELTKTLVKECLYPKLDHDLHGTLARGQHHMRGGLIYTVRLNGRRVRQRTVAATEMKSFRCRLDELLHSF